MLLFEVLAPAAASTKLRLLIIAAPYGPVSVGQGVNAVVLEISLVVESAQTNFRNLSGFDGVIFGSECAKFGTGALFRTDGFQKGQMSYVFF